MPKPSPHAPRLLVSRIQRFCVHDGPGIRTTVFTQGCSLSCWWCHNPDLRGPVGHIPVVVQASACTESRRLKPAPQASTGDQRDIEVQASACTGSPDRGPKSAPHAWDPRQLADHVQRDARYWRASGGGVTVSGGEPMVQAQALAAFLAELGRRGHDRCIETAGAVPRDHFRRVAPHVDRWLYDIKALDPKRFRAATGGDAAVPVANLRWLLGHTRTPVTVRVPLINGFNAGTDEPQRIAAMLADMPRPVGVEVLPGHNVGCDLRPGDPDPKPAPRQVDAAAEAFAAGGLEVRIRW